MSAAADRADLLVAMHRYRDAEAAAREAVAADPELATGYVHLARALAGQGRHDEAAAACAVGIGKAPQWGWPVAVLAWVRSDQKRFPEAIKLLRNALRLNPRDAFAHGQMAFALRESGRPRAAREAALDGLRLAPDDDFLVAQLGGCEKVLGKLNDAQATAERGLARHPDSTHLLGLHGCVLWARAGVWWWFGGHLYRRAYDVLLETVRRDAGAGWARANLDGCLKEWRRAVLTGRALLAGLGLAAAGALLGWATHGRPNPELLVLGLVFALPVYLACETPGFLHLAPLRVPAAPLTRGQKRVGRLLWGLVAVWALVLGPALVAGGMGPAKPAARR